MLINTECRSISTTASTAVFQFVLRGKLAGDWVQNLEHAWDTARSVLGAKELVVDLSGISEADEPGVALLSRMRQSGAVLTAAHPPQSESFLASLGVTTFRSHPKPHSRFGPPLPSPLLEQAIGSSGLLGYPASGLVILEEFPRIVILEFPVFHSIEKQVSSAFHTHIQIRYGIDLAVAVEQPRQSDFGEMAVPAAFQLAKQLRQAPRKIAAELVEEIGSIPGVSATWKGLAMEFTSTFAWTARLVERPSRCGDTQGATASGEKIIVESTPRRDPTRRRPYRPPAQRGARRHLRPHATRLRLPRRGAELHRRSLAYSGGRRRRAASTTWKTKRSAMCARCSKIPPFGFDYFCWDLRPGSHLQLL